MSSHHPEHKLKTYVRQLKAMHKLLRLTVVEEKTEDLMTISKHAQRLVTDYENYAEVFFNFTEHRSIPKKIRNELLAHGRVYIAEINTLRDMCAHLIRAKFKVIKNANI